jgi:hypothetical protein
MSTVNKKLHKNSRKRNPLTRGTAPARRREHLKEHAFKKGEDGRRGAGRPPGAQKRVIQGYGGPFDKIQCRFINSRPRFCQPREDSTMMAHETARRRAQRAMACARPGHAADHKAYLRMISAEWAAFPAERCFHGGHGNPQA